MAGRFEHVQIQSGRGEPLAFVKRRSAGGLVRSKPNAADRFECRIGELLRVARADHERAIGPALLQRRIAGDVVAVTVRANDRRRRQRVLAQIVDDGVRLEARVEDDAVIPAGKWAI